MLKVIVCAVYIFWHYLFNPPALLICQTQQWLQAVPLHFAVCCFGHIFDGLFPLRWKLQMSSNAKREGKHGSNMLISQIIFCADTWLPDCGRKCLQSLTTTLNTLLTHCSTSPVNHLIGGNLRRRNPYFSAGYLKLGSRCENNSLFSSPGGLIFWNGKRWRDLYDEEMIYKRSLQRYGKVNFKWQAKQRMRLVGFFRSQYDCNTGKCWFVWVEWSFLCRGVEDIGYFCFDLLNMRLNEGCQVCATKPVQWPVETGPKPHDPSLSTKICHSHI